MSNLSLTIYIITYNRSQYLEECISSVLAQSYNDFKIVILDNGSTDNTEEVVAGFNNKGIHYVKHSKNIGFAGNANFAIESCKTDLFVIFHDDDIMLPQYVEKTIKAFDMNSDLTIIAARTRIINDNHEKLYCNYCEGEVEPKVSFYYGTRYFRQNLRGKESIACSTVMYRTAFMQEKNLFFDQSVGPACDAYLWYEIERNHGKIGIIEDVLVNYRIHAGQISGKNWTNDYVMLSKTLCQSVYYKQLLESHKLLLAKSQLFAVLKTCSLYSISVISKEQFALYVHNFQCELIENNVIKKITSIFFRFAINNPQYYLKLYDLGRRAHAFFKYRKGQIKK